MESNPLSGAGTGITLSLKGQSIEMDEIEHLREMLEERNRAFVDLSELPHAELMDTVGVEPGATLSKVVAHRLEGAEERSRRLGSDARDALEDAGRLAVQSMYGALSEAETWRLCYRLAYLVGYDIRVAREVVHHLVHRANRQRQRGGQATRKAHRPYKAWALWLFRGLRFKPDGKRRQLQDLTHRIYDRLEAISPDDLPADAELPSEDTLRKSWLRPLWLKTPKRRPDKDVSPGG